MRTLPIDVAARYNFTADSRWKPFIGAGVRYVNSEQFSGASRFNLSRVEPELVGGVAWQVRRFSVLFEAQQLVGNHAGSTDPAFKPSVGIGWRW